MKTRQRKLWENRKLDMKEGEKRRQEERESNGAELSLQPDCFGPECDLVW